MADKSIGELKPTHIEDLPSGAHVYDEMLFAARYQGDTVKVSGEQLTAYLAPTVNADVEAAKTAAEEAAKSAQSAADVALYPPKVQGGNWWVWDLATRTYKDSGIDASVSLSIGTVTTGAPGTSAKVTNRGTSNAAILDITIPQGPKGDTGPVSSVNGETGAVTVGKLIGPSASVAVRSDVGYSGLDYYNNAGKFIGAIRVDPNPIGAEGGYHPIELVNEANSNGCRIYTQADPPPEEPPAVYTVYGALMNSADIMLGAAGAATVTVYRSGLVRVEFTAKITSDSMGGGDGSPWGLNANMLRGLNGAIPMITPISGGRGLVYKEDGSLDTDKVGYGMDFLASREFWVPQRVYEEAGTVGAWLGEHFKVGELITGTVYGTVAGAASIQDEDAQEDMQEAPQKAAQTENTQESTKEDMQDEVDIEVIPQEAQKAENTQENITQEEENEREHI